MVFIPEIKLYLKVLAIMIDADGPGTISSRKVASKKAYIHSCKYLKLI